MTWMVFGGSLAVQAMTTKKKHELASLTDCITLYLKGPLDLL